MEYQATLEFARMLDSHDDLAQFRECFYFPQHQGKKVIYFCGNSLGLQPKTLRSFIEQELKDWENLGVEGHFKAKNPWFSYHKLLTESTAKLLGAKPSEVVVMNSLTVNLHLMMVSFYRPTPKRFKILMEGGAFPSDQYAIESQVRFHGHTPKEAIIEIHPRKNEYTIRTEDIAEIIEQHSDELALVVFGGVNYYTGQAFDMKTIAEEAHRVGAFVGFDLAHAVGNIPLQLHQWKADFAVWCSYKYLNSGPGGVAGAFIHERHANKHNIPRFAGWWGHDEGERFLMQKGFKPISGAEGWQLSNAPILSMAALRASLAIFKEARMERLINKSKQLTSYLEFLIHHINTQQEKTQIYIITPIEQEERGCQLSLIFSHAGKYIFHQLTQRGVVADWREPNVIRVAPVPLYNSFEDVFQFYSILKEILDEK
ncbi:MAG: kynureninase [Flammeovirgaceae bacterium]